MILPVEKVEKSAGFPSVIPLIRSAGFFQAAFRQGSQTEIFTDFESKSEICFLLDGKGAYTRSGDASNAVEIPLWSK